MFFKLTRNCVITVLCGILVFCYLQISSKKISASNRRAYSQNIQNIHYQTTARRSFLADMLKCKDIPLEMQRIRHGAYWLIQNYVLGSISRNISCADSITMATNGDYTFMKHLPTLVKRWHAPVSLALYAPGYDFKDTMESIQYARNCLPESGLIKQFITFHIYFPEGHMPRQHIPLTENEALNWPYDCNFSPYAKHHILYRKAKNMTYPINVGRNIARKAVNTYFVFTNDIELYPSPGIVDKFLRMIKRNPNLVLNVNKRVFPLNVFELEKNAVLPNDREELKAMIKARKAFIFHLKLCQFCHEMPLVREWLNLTSVNEMSIMGTEKRYGKYRWWEPFYISDNREPVFDERISWEGQRNKRIQAYAMCLLDYEYHILNDGFLIHSPGIKKWKDDAYRRIYVGETLELINSIISKEYKILYGKNKRCKV